MRPEVVDESTGLLISRTGSRFPARVVHIALLPWWCFCAFFMMWVVRNVEDHPTATWIFVVVWALALLSVWWWLFLKLNSWRREGREAASWHPILWAIALPYFFPVVAVALLIPPFRRGIIPRLPRHGLSQD